MDFVICLGGCNDTDLLLNELYIVGHVTCLSSMILNLEHDFVLEYDLEFESSWSLGWYIMPWIKKIKDDHQIRTKIANTS